MESDARNMLLKALAMTITNEDGKDFSHIKALLSEPDFEKKLRQVHKSSLAYRACMKYLELPEDIRKNARADLTMIMERMRNPALFVLPNQSAINDVEDILKWIA